MARALAAAIAISLLAVSGAGGTGAQTPKRGGTVVVSFFAEPPCLSPLGGNCPWIPTVGRVLEGSFASLAFAPDSTLRARLVAGVTYTRKPPFTLTYRIRRGARWSDGVPITAGDFVFTQRAFEKQFGPDDVIRSVRVVDRKTVEVVLRFRFADWRGLFDPILPRHVLAGEDLGSIWTDRIDNPRTGEPIGNGPFLVQNWQRGERLTLVRNPGYTGPHVSYLDRLVLRFVRGDDDPVELLRDREADVVRVDDPALVPELRRISGVRVLPTPTLSWEHLAIRIGPGGNPVLRNKLARQALAYGIDRKGLVESLFGNIAPTLGPTGSAAFPTESPFYRPNWRAYRYRPAEARRLLERAGCRRGGDGVYACAGERLRLRLFTTAGNARRERTAELLAAQLSQIGVAVAPSFAPPATLFDQILPTGAFDLALMAWFPLEPAVPVEVYSCGGGRNLTGYCQRLVSRDLDQSTRILDAAQRARVLNRADAQLAKDVPVIPLFQTPGLIAARATVRNINPGLALPIWNAENWWLER